MERIDGLWVVGQNRVRWVDDGSGDSVSAYNLWALLDKESSTFVSRIVRHWQNV
jgi:hypothetical protein